MMRSAALSIAFCVFVFATASAENYVNETPVVVVGYTGDIMEPFLSRDGRVLFFNNNNAPPDKTDIHYAAAKSDGTFIYRGLLAGANSKKLDGVPTMDKARRFYFVSLRDYDKTQSTIHVGKFTGGRVSGAHLVPGNISLGKAFWFNMDVEASADGSRLYSTDNRLRFLFGGGVSRSDLFVAERRGGAFYRADNSDEIFANINTDMLEYAAAITSDEQTIFFNRTDMKALRRKDIRGIGIYRATRASPDGVFGKPERVEAITGFVEAPTISPDECILYYHRKVPGRFILYKVTREDCLAD
jgi:hypothetical protein